VSAPADNPILLRFGPFRLDSRPVNCERGKLSFTLLPNPAKCLHCSPRAPHKVFTRQEIQQEIWHGETFVDFEQGLNVAVRQIRAVLATMQRQPRYIETFPARLPLCRRGRRTTCCSSKRSACPPRGSSSFLFPAPACSAVSLALVVVAAVLVWRMGASRENPLTA